MKLVADLHIHTISSGHAYSTVEEYVAQAKKIGLKAIAITDHGPAMPGGPHWYHFFNLKMIPEKHQGIRIYRGVEANIINNEGKLDLPDDALERLDIVIVAMHPRCGYENLGEEGNTKVLLKTLKNPHVNVIAHPGNPMYPINVEQTVAAAKEKGVILEINNSSPTSRAGSWDRCLAFAREIKRQDWKVILTTDAHFSTMLGKFDEALKLIKEAGLTEKHVVNTSLAKIDKYLLAKK
ncbi:MAG: phosphatase [Candidatus Margulisbacteria bacterium]|nr:phosphatase [Candidatus Margulisiibacteriota bacterium]